MVVVEPQVRRSAIVIRGARRADTVGTDIKGSPGYTRFRGSSLLVGPFFFSGRAGGTSRPTYRPLCAGETARRWRMGAADG
jgi:hypothetical protein